MADDFSTKRLTYVEKRWDLIAAVAALLPLVVALIRSFIEARTARQSMTSYQTPRMNARQRREASIGKGSDTTTY